MNKHEGRPHERPEDHETRYNEDHEDREGHEDNQQHYENEVDEGERRSTRKRMRLESPLSEQEEELISEIIGAAIEVHRALGPGFLESIYRKAMCIEFRARGISYESERPVVVRYRESDISGQRVDLIVEGLIVVELKSVLRVDEIHRAQVLSYLKTTGLRGRLLINFRVPVLKAGIRRVVRFQP
jgi:GxxExxY protein